MNLVPLHSNNIEIIFHQVSLICSVIHLTEEGRQGSALSLLVHRSVGLEHAHTIDCSIILDSSLFT